ncbi:jg18574, partial [Pararge aegeria aegeria]
APLAVLLSTQATDDGQGSRVRNLLTIGAVLSRLPSVSDPRYNNQAKAS